MSTPDTPTRLLLKGANLFDSSTGEIVVGQEVLVAGGEIAGVGQHLDGGGAETLDLEGRTLLPGLIDAHVHVAIGSVGVTHDIQPDSLTAAEAKVVLEGMLRRGFTTVRDAGGADIGLHLAVERGLFEGPRLFIAGKAISQTGGHGDTRARFMMQELPPAGSLGRVGTVADGVDAVRAAAREQLRRGAHHIKIMAGGGVASPADPLEGLQYSEAEIAAIVEEATNAGTYALAHAYVPEAISRAVRAGVRSIEHGNLIDTSTAALMAERGAFLVPTLVTYDSLSREPMTGAWTKTNAEKLERVLTAGVEAIRSAKAAGVRIGFGTDLLGGMHTRQSHEFVLRAAVQSPAHVIRSATSINAELMGQSGQIGVIAAGRRADLIAVDGDPTRDITLLDGQGERLSLIIKGGRIHKNTIRGLVVHEEVAHEGKED